MFAGHVILPAAHMVITLVRTEGTEDASTEMNSAKMSSTSGKVTHIRLGPAVGVGADVKTSPLGGLGI